VAAATEAAAAEHDEVTIARRAYVLGTERHESRRIETSCAVVAGRQATPGSPVLPSLGDDLMRLLQMAAVSSRC